MRTALVLVALLSLTACGPDQLLGSYTFTMTGTDTETAPRSQNDAVSGMGTVAVTASSGKTADYVVTIAQSDTTPCVLEAKWNDKHDTINVTTGQTCAFTYATGSVTATMTSGTVKVDDKTAVLTLTVGYTFAGSTLGINFTGNGTRTYTGSRR